MAFRLDSRYRHCAEPLRRKTGNGQVLKVFVSKGKFRFLGWTAPGHRGGFTAKLRDLRPAKKPKNSLFRPPDVEQLNW